MKSIGEAFEGKPNFYCEKGATEEEIKKAEAIIEMPFADEYKEYLSQFGSVSCSGHELTGFSADRSLDVVKVTLDNRKKNPNITVPLYVVEETHLDGIVIWQSSSGEIFQAEYKEPPQKIYESLVDYVASFETESEADYK